ncbi:MAG: class I SAM-dependent methyltransferase [Bacteroidota bacterium]
MIDISDYTSTLENREGIFFAQNEKEVSYPKEGNNHCFQIEEDSFWFKHRNNCIIESVKRLSPNEVFFDIGGGNGYVAKGLEDCGIETVLIEPGIHGCLNARKRDLKNVICSTLEYASFHKGSLDSAGMFDVIEHIEDDVAFLSTMHSYLKSDGLAYITVPAFSFLWSNEDNDAGHYRRYTLGQLENKLISIGFTIEYSTYIFPVLPFPVFFFRTLPSKLGFNKQSAEIDKHKKEHSSKSGIINKILNRVWAFELGRIKSGKQFPFGGSCFVVARKIKQN